MTEVSRPFYHHERVIDTRDFTPSSHGGISYAFAIDQADQVVHVGVAVCSVKDNFNRKFGRTLAEQRLNAYLSGTQVVSAKDSTGIQYPMAFSVGVKDAIELLSEFGSLSFIRSDVAATYLAGLKIEDISIGALISIICAYFSERLLPFSE